MSVNALFILGLIFVPGLWNIVEYLFPLAMLAFAAIGERIRADADDHQSADDGFRHHVSSSDLRSAHHIRGS